MMDVLELKVVLEELRGLHQGQIDRLGYERDEREDRRAEDVCEKHGGHEFVDDKSPSALVRKVCKFCGKPEK